LIKRINSFLWNRRVKISCSTRLRESTIKNLRELLENQLILMKQTSENKLFNPFLSLFASNQARESDESKQSVPSDQISEPATTNDVLIVSLLQWHSSSMQWSIYSHRLTYQWIWFYVHMQIVSLLQWQVESWSLQWASRLVSLLQWHSLSMQWHIYSHRSTYQWIDLPHVHVQLVSLLQWQVDSQSLWWASRLVSLLQWSLYFT